MTDDTLTSRANVVLHLDNGAEMQFSGRPFAGGSWFDDETGELTRQKLYTTESGEHVYSIVTGKGQQRSRRAYRVSLHGEACTINDGRTEMTLDLEMLMLAVRALSGLERTTPPPSTRSGNPAPRIAERLGRGRSLWKRPFPLKHPHPHPPKTFSTLSNP
ncbi:MAG: hypothetical protein ACLR0N_03170 [Bilophila wadsworthia]